MARLDACARVGPWGRCAAAAGGCMVAFSAVIFGTGLRAEEAIVLPSGMLVTPLDTIHGAPGPDGLTIRFRFVAPDLADRPADETTLSDMTWLCESYALPRIATPGPVPEQIVITLADRPVEFGTVTPEAKQYFEAFRPDGGICVWEMF